MTNDWQARERAVNDALRELTPRIATELCILTESRWEAAIREPDGDRFTVPDFLIEGPAGARLRVSKDGVNDVMTRVEIRALFPPKASSHWRRDVTTSITVALTRGPEAMAADAARRLLPGYLPALAEAHRLIAEEEARQARRLARRNRLAEITGADIISHQQSESSSQLYLSRGMAGASGGSIRIWGDGSTGNLELSSVPYETLVALTFLLARINSQAKVAS